MTPEAALTKLSYILARSEPIEEKKQVVIEIKLITFFTVHLVCVT